MSERAYRLPPLWRMGSCGCARLNKLTAVSCDTCTAGGRAAVGKSVVGLTWGDTDWLGGGSHRCVTVRSCRKRCCKRQSCSVLESAKEPRVARAGGG